MSNIEESAILVENPLEVFAAAEDSTKVDERVLLDDQNQPNLSRAASATTTEQILDSDISHIKGFSSTSDSNQVVDLNVEGQLPEWLVSEHYTIGPGVYDVKYSRKIEIDGVLQSATSTFTLGHWFDALPLVNRFDINGERNTITYRHHLTTKRLVEKIRGHHGYAPNYPGGLFKTNPNQTMLIKLLNNGKKLKADRVPCNQRILTQIPGLDGRLFTQNFANHIQELDPFDLNPTQLQTWDEVNPDFRGYTSCPNGQVDHETGEYISFTMEVGYRTTRYHFFSISEQEPKGHLVTSIWNAPTGWVNGFSLTSNYIIMVVHPMLAHSSAVHFAWNESILDSFSFYPSEPTLFYVISRTEKQVIACYRAAACFSLNQVNAYEDVHGNIVLDMVCYEDDAIVHCFATEAMRDPEMKRLPPSEARRYVLSNPRQEASQIYLNNNSYIPSTISITSRVGTVWNYVTGQANHPENAVGASGWHAWMPTVKHERLSDAVIELPQINPFYRMQKHSFVYGIGNTKGNKIWDSIIKLDVNNNVIVSTWHEEHCYPSEAQFVPKPTTEKGKDEDTGVLISVVMNSARNTSFLLILDAKDLSVIAKSDLNKLVPLSLGRGCYRSRV
ncbi:carotenoid oxygenase [Sporodiniella umbellata]|nr:carotenoid oxygenase [Sporodiniella umbellata]